MTVVVSDAGEGDATNAVVELAHEAGEATAHVEQLSEEVAEATATAETAAVVAESAANVAAESVSAAELLMSQNTAILDGIEQVKSGILMISTNIKEFLEALQNEPEPEPEPPKRDTAPRRKSGAHKFLYGG